MDGHGFLRLTSEAFEPFLSDLGFQMKPPSVSGRFYEASFTGARHEVTLSYEPGDDAFCVMIFTREGDRWSDIDDGSRTPRLSDLNMRYMHLISQSERTANQAFFASVVVRDATERLVLKAANDLRLVLPRYLQA